MEQRVARWSGIGALALLLLAAPGPQSALEALTAAPAGDPTAPVVAAAALAAYLLVGWLLVVSLLTAGERLPGAVGRAAGGLGRRVAPAAVRRGVALTLGLTLSAGALGGTAAVASPRAPGAAGTAHTAGGPANSPAGGPADSPAAGALDWPASPSPVVAPALDWAAPEQPPATPATVVVAPGDSLWAIAADHLPAGTGNARIARTWPSWWAANRQAIGPDPDLIQPGTHLHAPQP
jgi:nucleoid-associated protein YgaU